MAFLKRGPLDGVEGEWIPVHLCIYFQPERLAYYRRLTSGDYRFVRAINETQAFHMGEEKQSFGIDPLKRILQISREDHEL